MHTNERPAKIYVFDGGDEYSVMFDGVVEADGDTVHIRYEESPSERVHLSVLGDIVTLNRVGELVYTLILEKDKPVALPVLTRYGTLSLAVTPKTVQTHISGQTIDIELAYHIGLGESLTEMDLKLRCDLY